MVQPINYMGMIPQPDLARSLASGLQLGTGIREMQQQRVAAEQAQAAKQQLAADVEAARADGSQKAWLGMIAKYPQFREAFGDVRKGVGEEQLKNEFFSGFEISNALEAGQPLVAAERLRTEIAARKNSGQPAGLYEQALARIEEGDSKRAQSGINEILSTLDPERFEKTVKAKTTAATAPAAVQKAMAEATKAEQEALNAVATAKDDVAKAAAQRLLAVAQADKAKVEADVALATKPSVISEAASKADKARVEAAFAERLQQAGLNKTNWDIKNLQSQIGDRAAKLNLDRQTTQATVAEKLSAIQQRLTDIPDGAMKLINEAATQSATSKQAATQYNDLAQRIESAEGGKGRFTSAAEWFAAQTGRQDAWTQIRNEYTRIRNTVAIKSLPPGPATDADIQLALRGIPPETANAATLASFLRGTAKLQDIDSAISNAKTDWLSQNKGVLTRAKTPFIAGDYAAKPGETFNDFAQRIVADVSAKYRPAEQVTEERRQQLISQIPTNQAPAAAAPSSSIEAQADAIIRGGR